MLTSKTTRWWTFAVVSIALFMGMLDNLVVLTALPAIRRALGASVSDLEWTVNAYTLTFAVLMMTGAALGDRFGRKRIFLIGVAISTLGSGAAALSDTGSHLAIARAVQGLGAAFLTPLTLTLLVRVSLRNDGPLPLVCGQAFRDWASLSVLLSVVQLSVASPGMQSSGSMFRSVRSSLHWAGFDWRSHTGTASRSTFLVWHWPA